MPTSQESRTSGDITQGANGVTGSDIIGHGQNTIGTQGPLHFVFGFHSSQINRVTQEPRSDNSVVSPMSNSQDSRSQGTISSAQETRTSGTA